MKLAPIISATVIMYAGGLKWGNLSQLLPEALLFRIQNLAHRKSTAPKKKKVSRGRNMKIHFVLLVLWASLQTGFIA